MKNRAVFLDRDGTINVEKNYLYKIQDFEFIPSVIDELLKLQNAGLLLVIITNQSGIGRGYYTEQDYDILTKWMIDELKKEDVTITGVYACPHISNASVARYRINCDCRKPKTGLFYKAAKNHDIDIDNSYAIGNQERDCAICKETKCQGFVIGSEYDTETVNHNNIKYVSDFETATKQILLSLEGN